MLENSLPLSLLKSIHLFTAYNRIYIGGMGQFQFKSFDQPCRYFFNYQGYKYQTLPHDLIRLLQ